MTAPYDNIAKDFSNARTKFVERETPYFNRLLTELAPESTILDIGCGTGIPVANYFATKGHKIIGIDPSAKQIEFAKTNVPSGTFTVGDVLSFNPNQLVDAIIAWDSIFFVPSDKHAVVFESFSKWLKPDGLLLCSLGGTGGQFNAPMFGHEFTFHALTPEKSKELLMKHFDIITFEVDDPSSLGHIAVLARKNNIAR